MGAQSIAAACISIYAFQALKERRLDIDAVRFIFTDNIKYHDVDSYQRLLTIMNKL